MSTQQIAEGSGPGAAAGRGAAWRRLGVLLLPVSWIYGAAVIARRAAWRGRAIALPAPVVSVGNITCGGTGKTPTVEMVARDLVALGWQPAILSRGYGAGTAPGADPPSSDPPPNDEHRILAANLPGVHHFQGPDRVRSGRRAISSGANILVLDDGFQHIRLRRDLDIALVDALNPFGGGRLLPAGLLREPVGSLRCADLLAVTRCDLAGPEEVERLVDRLSRRFPSLPLIRLRTRPLLWVDLDGGEADPRALEGQRVLAFCGIGNPEAFRRQILALGVELAGWRAFRDHHRYTRRDLEGLQREALRVGADALVMTQKDAVKIAAEESAEGSRAQRWLFLKISQTIESGEDIYRSALQKLGSPP
ncbi:MAG: tetraacyldisaccharide 4'-kinase [Planctomycetes bacterium]|nr:tetraacyldisaccharide 4'-kinase [Planctomycetota bacterium]